MNILKKKNVNFPCHSVLLYLFRRVETAVDHLVLVWEWSLPRDQPLKSQLVIHGHLMMQVILCSLVNLLPLKINKCLIMLWGMCLDIKKIRQLKCHPILMLLRLNHYIIALFLTMALKTFYIGNVKLRKLVRILFVTKCCMCAVLLLFKRAPVFVCNVWLGSGHLAAF